MDKPVETVKNSKLSTDFYGFSPDQRTEKLGIFLKFFHCFFFRFRVMLSYFSSHNFSHFRAKSWQIRQSVAFQTGVFIRFSQNFCEFFTKTGPIPSLTAGNDRLVHKGFCRRLFVNSPSRYLMDIQYPSFCGRPQQEWFSFSTTGLPELSSKSIDSKG